MKWLIEPVAVALGIVLVIVVIVLFGAFSFGATQKHLVTPTPVPVAATVTEIPTTVPTPETTPPTPETTTPPPTPTPPRTDAAAATPYDDKKYYKLPYYSTVYDPRANMPPVFFQQSYDGRFQSEAVVANVVQAPLIVDFTLTQAQSPTRSFFYITVRNNATQELLAQDGFFGPYSIDTSKRLFFSTPGSYHINMYGGFVSVDLTLRAPT
ncbi:MAG: hypothetical protein ABSD81_04295 [Methanomicrobiales archaeon]|jgi:hypothetical protein